jgi:hypothetical protein
MRGDPYFQRQFLIFSVFFSVVFVSLWFGLS